MKTIINYIIQIKKERIFMKKLKLMSLIVLGGLVLSLGIVPVISASSNDEGAFRIEM
jgi:membrane protein CcdC involved in cytochrome C biogenesis